MTYGLSPRLFIENGPAVQAAKAIQARSSRNMLLSWRNLDAGDRLALIERALNPGGTTASCPAI